MMFSLPKITQRQKVEWLLNNELERKKERKSKENKKFWEELFTFLWYDTGVIESEKKKRPQADSKVIL